MACTELLLYRMKDFVRLNEYGEIDFNVSLEIIRKAEEAARVNPSHGILLDFRDTVVLLNGLVEIAQLVLETIKFKVFFKRKIAVVIPADAEPGRVRIASALEAHMRRQGIDHRFFFSFEEAIDWLAEPKRLDVE